MSSAGGATDGLSGRRRTLALIGLWAGMVMSVLDGMVVTLALPAIARDVATTPAAAVWVVTAYQIAIVMALLPVAALGERLGYLRVYTAGLILFVAMSLACAVSPTLTILAAFRFVQGLGAAAMMAVNGALIRHVWPRHLLGRGIGYNATVIAASAAASPAIGAAILSLAGWQWLFLVNVPIGIGAVILALRHGPRTPPETQRFDTADAVLSAAMTGLLFLAFSDLAHGEAGPRTAIIALSGLVLGAILVGRLRKRDRPIIPLDLFRVLALRFAYGASIAAFAGQTCLLVTLPFLLEGARGLTAATVGLVVLPMPIGMGLAAPWAGRHADRGWAGRMSAAGLVLMAAMLALIALLAPSAPVVALAPCMALVGIGFGLFQAPNNHVMLRTGPIGRAGAAAGMLAQCRLTGQTIGALIALAGLHLAGHGSAAAIVAGALLALAAAALALRRSPPPGEHG